MKITKPPVQNESIWEFEYRLKQEAKEALIKDMHIKILGSLCFQNTR